MSCFNVEHVKFKRMVKNGKMKKLMKFSEKKISNFWKKLLLYKERDF